MHVVLHHWETIRTILYNISSTFYIYIFFFHMGSWQKHNFNTNLRTFLWGLFGSLWYGMIRGWKSSSPAPSLESFWASPLPIKSLPLPSSSAQESSVSPCVQDTIKRLKLHPRDSPRIRGKAGLNRAKTEERRISSSYELHLMRLFWKT